MVKRLVPLCALTAAALTAHAMWNLRKVRRPSDPGGDIDEDITVLIPARDEASHIAATIHSARSQECVPNMTIRVLDDGSRDDTLAVATAAADDDPRVTVEHAPDAPLPDGWLGKNYACHRLSESAGGTVLAFIDADVELRPRALTSLVAEMRAADLDLIAPYPRQLAGTWLERLVQPLLVWSWMTTIPLGVAESRQWASMSAANGQLLVFDAAAYRRIGGHERVRGEVIEDVALMRAIRDDGGRAATVDGSHLATCRMYADSADLVEGYTKSAWKAFGGIAGSIVVNSTLVAVYVLPPLAAVFGRGSTRAWGLFGYVSGVLGRVAVARSTGERVLPDALAHPVSIAAFVTINKLSWWKHLSGTTTWKGRTLPS